ncbi:MAG: hypothetical protein CW338_10315 [Clostridiales bacterium]|nr:hypothetical protein [Clostridiales bacterium]
MCCGDTRTEKCPPPAGTEAVSPAVRQDAPAPSVPAQKTADPAGSSLREKLSAFISEPKQPATSEESQGRKTEIRTDAAPSHTPEKPIKTESPQQQEIPVIQNSPDGHAPIFYIGTVFNTYILLECGDRMLLCDQHAAHERILYERFVKETEHDGGCQELLVPVTVQPTPAQYAAFLDNGQLLKEAGFDCEEFGSGSIRINGVPVILGEPQAAGCFSDALDELSVTGFLSRSDKLSRLIQTACKHAVKGGEKLDTRQLTGLVGMILSKKIPPTCPHGRPLFVEVTQRDIEKRFKRIQD